ncbi:MAG: hypothetical protein HYX33_01510 [Actinobacteria bacterium]|nr:hypothetical protein [Actinomycetota bacterium]
MRRPLLIPLVLGALALVAGCGGSDPAPTTTGGTPTTDAAVVLDRPVAARGPAPIAGIEDDRLAFPNTVAPEDPTARIALAASLGGRQVRVALPWSAIAPTPPTKPTDPSDPAYDWRRTDAIVRAARRRGVEVLFTVYQTPAWAADGSVPVVAPWPAEARRPRDAADLGAFATAAARRYAPKGVLRWEGWNEPNTPRRTARCSARSTTASSRSRRTPRWRAARSLRPARWSPRAPPIARSRRRFWNSSTARAFARRWTP